MNKILVSFRNRASVLHFQLIQEIIYFFCCLCICAKHSVYLPTLFSLKQVSSAKLLLFSAMDIAQDITIRCTLVKGYSRGTPNAPLWNIEITLDGLSPIYLVQKKQLPLVSQNFLLDQTRTRLKRLILGLHRYG